MITPLIILLLLVAPGLLAWVLSPSLGLTAWSSQRRAYGLGLCFVFFGIGHFAQTNGMVAMLPEFVPARRELVWLTGAGEWLVALGLFTTRFQRVATLAGLAMFVGFFPANVWAAWQQTGLGGHQWGLVYLWIRAPLQAILIVWSLRLLALTPAQKTTA
ncbi:hypothetical protein [Reinekea blandensis]|uniref:DoxX family protein n=1 Tax=Reinekea blandensis MED297 TaxID=314283 RepID=A4BKJ0_9GAMM|nr:hypothetical protein [Reinekea blandensis]EAR07343.1 hypothetical protein MED297_07636 [Reinekea sp. MED297] [Reinekea blandensis MED297]